MYQHSNKNNIQTKTTFKQKQHSNKTKKERRNKNLGGNEKVGAKSSVRWLVGLVGFVGSFRSLERQVLRRRKKNRRSVGAMIKLAKEERKNVTETEIETDRQTDRQTERQRERERVKKGAKSK
jgi:hypothetical protein